MQQDISVQRASGLEQTFFEALHAQLPCAEMQNLRLFTRNASTEAQNCSDTTQAQRLRTAQNQFCVVTMQILEHSISHLLLSFFMSIMPQLILFDISNICFLSEQDSSSSWDLKLSCSDCVLCFMHSIEF